MADISSLGIGSGVLTADVIDQLKAADESVIIAPLEAKITLNNQKQDATELLTALMKTFKASASALSYDTIFDSKNVVVDGNATVTVEDGANVESFTLETIALAKKEITQFGGIANKDASIASADGTLKINIGSNPDVNANPLSIDNTLEIEYTAGMSLSDLAQAITDQSDGKIDASVLQTGENEYSLVIASASTGADQKLSFEDAGAALNSDLLTNAQEIQPASDSEFKYNGITVTRSTNEITDVIVGVTMNLKEEGDVSNVSITQNTDTITDEMQLFVDSYNTLLTNIEDMTLSDDETGSKGVFNGDSFVKSIKRELNTTISAMHEGDSLMNYGISIDRYGTMSLDTSTLDTKLAEDPEGVKNFFSGIPNEYGVRSDGMFTVINDKLNSYTGYNKLLANFDSSITTEGENLENAYTRAQATLDSRYEIMTKRFTAYDTIINSINSSFSYLEMMIAAESE